MRVFFFARDRKICRSTDSVLRPSFIRKLCYTDTLPPLIYFPWLYGRDVITFSLYGTTQNCKAILPNLYPSHKVGYNSYILQKPPPPKNCHGLCLVNPWLIAFPLSKEQKLQPDMYWVQFPQALVKVNNKGKYSLKTKSYNQTSFQQHFQTSLDLNYWISQEWKVMLLWKYRNVPDNSSEACKTVWIYLHTLQTCNCKILMTWRVAGCNPADSTHTYIAYTHIYVHIYC